MGLLAAQRGHVNSRSQHESRRRNREFGSFEANKAATDGQTGRFNRTPGVFSAPVNECRKGEEETWRKRRVAQRPPAPGLPQTMRPPSDPNSNTDCTAFALLVYYNPTTFLPAHASKLGQGRFILTEGGSIDTPFFNSDPDSF